VNLVSVVWTSARDALRHTGLHRDALFLASAAIVSGLGSLIYWKLITLRFPVEMVGLASAGIASATFLSGLSSMGLTTGLVRFIPTQDAVQKAGLIRAAVQISFSIGVVIGLIFLVGRHWWAPLLFPPQAGPVYIIIFFALLLTTLQVNINTSVIQAERHTPYLLAQSMIVNVVQIAGRF
jgi:O-antigen/teichoic acid export membrane protein